MKTKKIEIENTKIARCRYHHISLKIDHTEDYCVVDKKSGGNVRIVSKEDCEKCDRYKSRFLEFPLTIQGIENKEIDTNGFGPECGCLCEISPCGQEYQGKSYIGIYLGELPFSIYTSFDDKTGILKNQTMNNPAIFVPELKKIIYGCESWWRKIERIEDFRGISEEDIQNTWYVQLLKGLKTKEEKGKC